MNYVFVAVGGGGTKVAEALVRLLTVGFPTRQDNGVATSTGDSTLRIWCVDSDLNSGAKVALDKALADYRAVQKALSDSPPTTDRASSSWAIDIETKVRVLNPVQLGDKKYKTLQSLLAAHNGDLSAARLAAFYTDQELNVAIDGGFYQRPFIGAAVMPLFAKSLETNSDGNGKEAGLTDFDDKPTKFFLCGSLHGGTGACGVPVLGRFLQKRKKDGWKWRIGCCLLAPYCKPSSPPFLKLEPGKNLADEIAEKLLTYGATSPFKDLPTPEEKQEQIKQILLGFYAAPGDIVTFGASCQAVKLLKIQAGVFHQSGLLRPLAADLAENKDCPPNYRPTITVLSS